MMSFEEPAVGLKEFVADIEIVGMLAIVKLRDDLVDFGQLDTRRVLLSFLTTWKDR